MSLSIVLAVERDSEGDISGEVSVRPSLVMSMACRSYDPILGYVNLSVAAICKDWGGLIVALAGHFGALGC